MRCWIPIVIVAALSPGRSQQHAPDTGKLAAAVTELDKRLQAFVRQGRTASLREAVEAWLVVADGQFADQSAYLLAKNGALHSLDRHEEARAVFARVPDADLRRPHHIFNRLGRRVHEDPMACLPMVKRLAASPRGRTRLANWLHQGYVQSYAPAVREGARSQAHRNFVRELRDATSPELAKACASFCVYVNAAHVANDPEKLRAAAARPLGGEASRPLLYKLLLARLLDRHAATRDGAKALVASVIAELTETPAAADTPLDKARDRTRQTEDRYLLATACWLEALAARRDDGDATARRWLERAARYSPTWRWRGAYASFYDRHLLEAKEEYRTDYADLLQRLGEAEAALQVRVTTALAEPERRGEAESLFAELHPNEDFGAWFESRLSRDLPAAPPFSLKTVDGEPVQLADYRGKWLLLEFWGTW